MTAARIPKILCAALGVLSLGLGGCGASKSGMEAVPVSAPGAGGGSGDDSGAKQEAPGFAAFKFQCGNVPGVVGDPGLGDPSSTDNPVKYCVYQNSPNPRMTVWFFHGLGDNETVFQNPDVKHDSYRQFMEKLPPARIITISYGMLWMFSAQSSRAKTPYEGTVDVFRNKIVPFFESAYNPPKPWHVMGHSMGGFNTSVLCTSMPDTWSKCVLLNAMIPSCDPFTGAFPGGLPPVGGGIGGIAFCHPGPDAMVKDQFEPAEYAAAQPSALMAATPRLPKTYVTACINDDFGLFTGPKAFALQGQARGFNVTFEPLNTSCDHYKWPHQRVVDFLSQ